MSFYTSNRNENTPGPIVGNPLYGLCEKACIQVNKVFDACIQQETIEGVQLSVSNITPSGSVEPYTFVSAKSSSVSGTINDLSVDRLEDRPNFARVKGNVTIPLEVVFVDSTGAEFVAESSVSIPKDVILYVPEPSIIPYNVESVVSAISTVGTYSGSNIFTVTMCITVILKIVIEAELLVPTYGYCAIPPCQEYTQEVCEGFFDLPLFPSNNFNSTII